MILILVKRNLKVYMRDKGAVFFSLLGMLIILALYVLFLGKGIEKELAGIPGASYLMDTYIMSGVLCVGTVTTTLGAYCVMLEDITTGRRKEFEASPLYKEEVSLGYFFSAFVIGMAVSLLSLLVAEVYIVYRGGSFLSFGSLLKVLYVLLLLVLCSDGFSFLLVSFVKSNGAYSGMNVIVGTLVGFITGVYIPIGTLGSTMQWVVKLFPISHGGVLLRQLMMEDAVRTSFVGADIEEVREFQEVMGIRFFYGGSSIPDQMHILILLGSGLVFAVAGVWNMKQR